MIDPLELVLQQAGLNTPAFSPNSRYFGIQTAKLETTDGEAVVYVRRRFISPPEQFELLQEHIVSEGERPDLLAHQYLGDAVQFWRICDANAVMSPNELTETLGKTLRITLPEGISGTNNA